MAKFWKVAATSTVAIRQVSKPTSSREGFFLIGRPDGVEGLVELRQIQGVVAMQLVKSRAADGTAAVVPEGDGGLVGRIILAGEFQEVLEGLGIAMSAVSCSSTSSRPSLV